jgi:hypothetical protein
MEIWCNNCGKGGHAFSQCKIPITSFGCIVFRNNKETKKREYLMICRRYTIAYLEFVRGKYIVTDKESVIALLQQMTNRERELIAIADFRTIWNTTWGGSHNRYYGEDAQSSEKFSALCRQYNMAILLKECLDNCENTSGDGSCQFPSQGWNEPEWGFPKGRREYKETDYNCAIREFQEETGIRSILLQQIKNIIPVEENFMGSNFKSYKHKYYLMYMDFDDTITKTDFQKSEVSCLSWKTCEECIECIRPYNLEKKALIKNIDTALRDFFIFVAKLYP